MSYIFLKFNQTYAWTCPKRFGLAWFELVCTLHKKPSCSPNRGSLSTCKVIIFFFFFYHYHYILNTLSSCYICTIWKSCDFVANTERQWPIFYGLVLLQETFGLKLKGRFNCTTGIVWEVVCDFLGYLGCQKPHHLWHVPSPSLTDLKQCHHS